ncbi:MAG TPA: NAD(P)H-dependent oxidoreductase, partial [Usitatibacter sp.]
MKTKTLLQIQASIFSDGGESSRLASRFVSRWRADQPGADVIVRDLGREPVPHLTAERFQSFLAKPDERTPAQRGVSDYSDNLIAELERADVIVLGLPMYNFGVPSTLKAYFDHIARAGRTFKYTEKGPVGLLTGKKAFVFATRGGLYAGTPLDTQTSYV